MTLLELVIIAHRCRSTHHFIAIDALTLLKGKDASLWHNLILRYHDSLLKGAKAPDKQFKDFKNHVLHVEEGEWGGARDAAMEWYGKAVAALRNHRWSDAVFALGVMTHYYADPIQPFHTGQTEEEGAMHRALEWSIAKSRDTIKAMIDAKGYPVVSAGSDTGFVADMVLAGAKYANPHYQTFIDHYDLDKGVKDPPSGLDETLLEITADLVAYATAGIATLFERAFAEAAVEPPVIDLDLPGYLAALDIPIRKITKRMQDKRDRRVVEAMYAELQDTGKVIKTLPADDKQIRKLHAKQVLRTSLKELDAQPLKPIGTKHVPMQAPPRPVEYVLKLVPVPVGDLGPTNIIPAPVPEMDETVEAAPDIAPEAPELSEPAPDPEVFDISPVKLVVPEPEAVIAQDETVVEAEADANPELAAETETEAASDATTSGPETDAPTPAAQVLAALEAQADTLAPETEIEPEAEPAEAAEAVTAEVETNEPAETEVIEEPVEAKTAPPKPKPKKAKSNKASKADRTDRLTMDSPVVDAPSIGPKTAERLKKVGITTIGDLLRADAKDTAADLNVRYITVATLTDWQDQTRLMLEAPGLRVLDSQILVGAGIRNAKDLANASARSVLKAATSFLETPSGSRVLWGSDSTVDETEVKQWIDLARTSNS